MANKGFWAAIAAGKIQLSGGKVLKTGQTKAAKRSPQKASKNAFGGSSAGDAAPF